MIGNVVDNRTDRFCPEVDAAYEPSAHDGVKRPNGSECFPLEDAFDNPAYFVVTAEHDTTVRDAILAAETRWPFPVTVFLYDRGTRPLGW